MIIDVVSAATANHFTICLTRLTRVHDEPITPEGVYTRCQHITDELKGLHYKSELSVDKYRKLHLLLASISSASRDV